MRDGTGGSARSGAIGPGHGESSPSRDGRKGPLVISLVGGHNAGKTTIGEALVDGWTQMGFSVAVLKHEGKHPAPRQADAGPEPSSRPQRPSLSTDDGRAPGPRAEASDWEKPGSDTRRYAAKGARYTVLAGAGESLWRVIEETDCDNPEAMVKKVENFIVLSGGSIDIILVEGYKRSILPKVVVLRCDEDFAWIRSLEPTNVVAAVCPSDFACLADVPWRVYHDSHIRQLCADLMH